MKKIVKFIIIIIVPAERRVISKESEKNNNYLDHARERKKKMNMRVTVIPVVIGTLDTVTK